MKIREIIFGAIAAVVLLLGFKALFPGITRFEMVLTGTTGAKVQGTYECDGITIPFIAALPATIVCDVKRTLVFRAMKENKADTLAMSVSSDVIVGQGEAGPSDSGVMVNYRAVIKKFQSKGEIGPIK